MTCSVVRSPLPRSAASPGFAGLADQGVVGVASIPPGRPTNALREGPDRYVVAQNGAQTVEVAFFVGHGDRDGGSVVLAVDTNVLVYAADADSQFSFALPRLVGQRARPDAWYTT